MPPDLPNVETSRDLEQLIETWIVDGTLEPGDRLEPIRPASTRYGLSPTTIAAAYRRLTERGLVVPMGRRGTFVNDEPAVPGNQEADVPSDLIDLASGNADPHFLPDLRQYMTLATEGARGFGAPGIDSHLEAAATAELARAGLEPSRVVITSGALDAVERALEAHLRPGAAVGIEDPGYPWLRSLVTALGLRPVPLAVDDDGIVPESLRSVLHHIQALISTPRAQNPFGSRRTEDRATDLREAIADRPDLLVIEDDYLALSEPSPLRLLTDDSRPWLLVQSVTKALNPDLRVAWAIGDPMTLDRVEGRQQVGQGWVSRILQRAVAEILNDTAAIAAVRESAVAYRSRREGLISALNDLGLRAYGASGMNVWLPVGDETTVVASAADAGFAVRPGQRYRQASPPGVRITLSNLQEEDIGRLATAVAVTGESRSTSRWG